MSKVVHFEAKIMNGGIINLPLFFDKDRYIRHFDFKVEIKGVSEKDENHLHVVLTSIIPGLETFDVENGVLDLLNERTMFFLIDPDDRPNFKDPSNSYLRVRFY